MVTAESSVGLVSLDWRVTAALEKRLRVSLGMITDIFLNEVGCACVCICVSVRKLGPY